MYMESEPKLTVREQVVIAILLLVARMLCGSNARLREDIKNIANKISVDG